MFHLKNTYEIQFVQVLHPQYENRLLCCRRTPCEGCEALDSRRHPCLRDGTHHRSIQLFETEPHDAQQENAAPSGHPLNTG